MEILDRSHDRFHLIDEPGGYEWTYYDGFSGDGSVGFTAIWFRGVPMSPNYSRAIERGGVPVDHAAFAFHLYRDRRTVASWLVEGDGRGLFSEDPGAPLRFGGGSLWLEQGSGGELNARIAVDGRSPVLGRRVEGEIDLRFPAVDLGDLAGGQIDRSRSDHYWVPSSPVGTFSAALDLSGRLRGRDRLRFTGEAYHDRNLGFSPLMTHDVDWIWGRLHSREHTLIFFSVVPDGGTADDLEIRQVLLISDGRLRREAKDLHLDVDRAPHWATLRYPSTITGTADGDDRLRLRVDRPHLLESGPFYHRMIASIEAEWGEDRLAGEGTIEYFRPDRLRIAPFRPFIRTRVRRRSPERFGR